jgi:hypothetical protein
MSYLRDEIVSNLEALSNQLEEQGSSGEMFVVGGVYGTRV